MSNPHDPSLNVAGGAQVRGSQGKPGTIPLLLFGVLGIAVVALAFVLLFAALAAGVVLIGGAMAWFGFRRATGRLATVEELAARHGVTPRDIERILEEQQIRANVVINGRPMYDARSLKEPGRLLRATGGQVIDAELLRQTDSAQKDDRLLLRYGNLADSANSVPVIDVLESNPRATDTTPD